MYIRSGLISLVNESEAVNLIKETQLTLKTQFRNIVGLKL